MRDYTKVPGYEDMTQPQARYNYLHDLLDWYQGLTKEDRSRFARCKVLDERKDCRYCSFSGFLGGDPEVCCAWRAEAQPDKAIEILEMLLGKQAPIQNRDFPGSESDDVLNKIMQIVKHYSKASQMGIAQEECAELIQAISKVRRKGETEDTLDHLAEEIADVRIVCCQLSGIFGVTDKVNQYELDKLDRQLKRIKEGDTAYETTSERP